ncbi:MAG: PQQ-like beta-propeller repeat protein [Prevotellaceae bacterium]|jgi:outer membrane protein assembly factor BamB|nr:PQQ-like beta-propeller repeat protein [Prevotellaceae bacterium]
MKNFKPTVTLITVAVALCYAALIAVWHLYVPRRALTVQLPGADNRPEGTARKADDVRIGEFFMKYAELPPSASPLTGIWNGFRGKQFDNIIGSPQPIRTDDAPYAEQWSVATGEGHAAPAILNGRVYFLDYDESLNSDALRCFSLETGKELWRRWYRVPIKRNHGFSRTIPAVGEGYVITIGPEGHVMCCDPITGDLRWTLDMQQTYHTEVPFWYTGQCPHVDGGTLVLAPAGEEVLMAGIDCLTGEEHWRTPNSVHYKMSHSSVMPMTIGGKRMYVYIGVGGACGVSAEAADRGALLWSAGAWQPSVVAPSPVQIGANRILMVAGYGNGGALLQVNHTAGRWTASVTDRFKPNEGVACEQQTPLFYHDRVISVLPKDGGANRGKLVCYAPDNLRTPVWTSAADERFGLGPYLIIDNRLFVFKDDGELYVYALENGGEMKLLKRQRIIADGVDAWGPMAYADGRLLLRDAHKLVCILIG